MKGVRGGDGGQAVLELVLRNRVSAGRWGDTLLGRAALACESGFSRYVSITVCHDCCRKCSVS